MSAKHLRSALTTEAAFRGLKSLGALPTRVVTKCSKSANKESILSTEKRQRVKAKVKRPRVSVLRKRWGTETGDSA